MIIIKAFYALIKGMSYCISNPAVRKLAVWPVIVGFFSYIGSIIASFYFFPYVREMLTRDSSGIWAYLWYGIGYIAAVFALLVATLVISVVLVMIFTSVFQSAIAAAVLKDLGREIPEEKHSISGSLQSTGKSILNEIFKAAFLIPLSLLGFIIGFFPLFTPIALLLAAWLLAFQFVDIVLEIYNFSGLARLRFSLRNSALLCAFGSTLTVLWAIPLVGLLLPPAAAAGAAWLLCETMQFEQLNRNKSTTKSQN